MSTYYEAHGDTLVSFFYDEDMYDEQIDAVLKVFRSFAEKRIVGVQISDITTILSNPGVRKCDYLWAEGGTILAVPIELARRHAGTAVDDYAAVIEQLGAKPFRLPDDLRELIAAG